MNYNHSPNEIKGLLKQGLIYLLIALPFVAVVAVGLTIAKVNPLVIMLCNVVVGGIVILVAYIIHSKIKEKRAEKQKNSPKKFDPFKD